MNEEKECLQPLVVNGWKPVFLMPVAEAVPRRLDGFEASLRS
jgi:hypothetical protein